MVQDRRDIVAPPHAPRPAIDWPLWFRNIFSVGITTSDPDMRRRQTFCNVAAIAGALNALSHLVTNSLYDFDGLLPVNIYNVALAVLALSTPLLHRYGDNVAACFLGLLLIGGHTFVVFALGASSGLLVYYTLFGAALFVFGVQNWKLFLLYFGFAALGLLAGFYLAGPEGFVLPGDSEFRQQLSIQGLINALAINGLLIAFALRSLRRAETALAFENARAEALLEAIMPRAIAARLRSGNEERIADRLDGVSILFTDIVGFTPAARDLPPEPVVAYLDALYSHFDGLARTHGVSKIKTIGDAYMAIARDAPDASEGTGARAIARFALSLLEAMDDHRMLGENRLDLRIGIHHGSAIAGVIGQTRFSYDVWGEAVNTAARMESHGLPGRVQVSAAFANTVESSFTLESRGMIDIKGMGQTETYLLLSERVQAAGEAPRDNGK